MPDEPTPWELQRTLQDMRQDMRDGFSGLNARFDRVVSAELFAAYQQAVNARFEEQSKRVTAIEEQRTAEKTQRAGDRRLVLMGLFTAILSPVLLLFLQLYLTTRS